MSGSTTFGGRLLTWLSGSPQWLALSIAFAGIIGAALVDWWTGPDLSLLLFYAAFVTLLAWRCSWRWSSGAVVLVSGVTAITQLGGSDRYPLGIALWNVSARLVVLLLLAWILGQLRDSLAREQQRARIDVLTGAANRLAFEELATRELVRARRSGNCIAAAFLDLDELKTINDRRGHHAGDQALRCLADVARDALRATDVFARIGGDEFVVVLPDTDPAAAGRVCQRIVGEFHRRSGGTVSIGVATWSPRQLPAGVDEILSAGDGLMYHAKRRGGSQVTISRRG